MNGKREDRGKGNPSSQDWAAKAHGGSPPQFPVLGSSSPLGRGRAGRAIAREGGERAAKRAAAKAIIGSATRHTQDWKGRGWWARRAKESRRRVRKIARVQCSVPAASRPPPPGRRPLFHLPALLGARCPPRPPAPFPAPTRGPRDLPGRPRSPPFLAPAVRAGGAEVFAGSWLESGGKERRAAAPHGAVWAPGFDGGNPPLRVLSPSQTSLCKDSAAEATPRLGRPRPWPRSASPTAEKTHLSELGALL